MEPSEGAPGTGSPAPNGLEGPSRAALAASLDRLGAEHLALLRRIAEETGRRLDAEIAARDERIDRLEREIEARVAATRDAAEREVAARLAERDAQIAELSHRLALALGERDGLEERLRLSEALAERYREHLRALAERIRQEIETTGDAAPAPWVLNI
ncbi:MAG: hypothetical protein IRY97_05785 [Thermomicrobiaceae bacterium]|nr:hypothetical protein [Thermomicrobiaceae bacterium]